MASRRFVFHVLDFCMLVTYIAPAGEYSLTDKVIEVEFGGVKKVCTPFVGLVYVCHLCCPCWGTQPDRKHH